MNGILAIFVRHKVAANVMMLIAFLMGLLAINRMNVQFFPTFALDVISVRVVWTGASAEDVERSITTPLEERLKTVDGLKRMASTSAQGVANITLELVEGTDPLLALDQVRQRVDEFRNLPKDAETPQISRVSSYEPIARLLVRGPSIEELRPWVREFERELLARGIDRVDITGLPQERIAIEIPSAVLETLGQSLVDVGDRINQLARDVPAGMVGNQDGAREVRGLEQRRDTLAFENLPIVSDEHGLVRLHDVATIRREARPASLKLSEKGETVIELLLQRAESGHSLKAARILDEWLKATRPRLPPSIQIEVYDQQWELIRDRINLLLSNGLSGLLLVLIILYLFLPGRVAFWVAVGIPTAFLATLALLMLFGGTINMISLFALIMALGIIVDDAIVVGEDADTHRKMGESPEQAALGGARRMFWPVAASSLTTVAAFLPLMLVGGVIGKILFDIPFVMVIVIMASLLESFLILPAHLKTAFAHEAQQKTSRLRTYLDQAFERFREQRFRPMVRLAIEWRGSTLALALAAMILAVGLLAGGRIPFVFFPTPESQVVYANATFVAGTPRTQTEAFLRELERSLRETEEQFGGQLVQIAVTRLGSTVAAAGTGASATGDQLGSMIVEMVPSERRQVRNETFLNAWRANVRMPAGLESLTLTSRQSGPPGRDLTIRLSGDDANTLKTAALELAETLKAIPGVTDTVDDMPFGREQLIFRLTPAGEALGLTTESLGYQLRAAFDGHLAQLVQVGQDELEVRVLLPRDERERLDVFERMTIRLPSGPSAGQFVPLATVAAWESRRGFEALRHAEGRLAVEVSAEVDKHQNNANTIIAELKKDVLPRLAERYGIEYSSAGRAADQRETMADMRNGLILGLAFIYLILVWVFGSWGWPLVVMTAIPLGLAGAIFGHWVMGIDLTILSMFGLFGLSGIVVNNAIILVSLYSELRAKGMNLHDALIEAACGRLRAVLLTSLTTIGGLTPLLFETSLQAQFLIPMATSIAFGLGFATLLVLFFIPALLYMLESLKQRLGIAGSAQAA
ncbi:MAG: efflux RND transporter permease subunit [Gammaproteobacteria bacterium]|nr:efflux RND transporter permease subunit [Gammaproteobacteria bacterium]